MTLTQFIKKHLGAKVDFDGAFGAQCVDLYRAYCRDVLNVPQSPAVSGAKDIIEKPGALSVAKGVAVSDCEAGDVLVWGATETNPYGHVAVLVAPLDARHFVVFEQDGFRQDGAKLAVRGGENLLGCLRKA